MDYSLFIEEFFREDGVASRYFSRYSFRAEQMEMALELLKGIENQGNLFIEAGTGTGKTFAYLLPLLLKVKYENKRVVVSTHSRVQQEQIKLGALDPLMDVLDMDPKEFPVLLLQGMQNYLCLKKLDLCDGAEFSSLREEKNREERGLYSDFSCSSKTWGMVAANAEDCSYGKCPLFKECFYFRARQALSDARCVIVNHKLLANDFLWRERKDSGRIEGFDFLVIDEAHQFEPVVREELSARFTPGGVQTVLGQITRDISVEEAPSTCVMDFDVHIHSRILPEIAVLEQLLVSVEKDFSQKLAEETWKRLRDPPTILKQVYLHMQTLQQRVEEFLEWLGEKGLHNIEGVERKRVKRWLGPLERHCQSLSVWLWNLEALTKEEWLSGEVLFLEKRDDAGPTLRSAPVHVAEQLKKLLWNNFQSTICCSATLSVKEDFSYLTTSLGLSGQQKVFYSPFCYKIQALLGVVHLTSPKEVHSFTKESHEAIFSLVKASGGGAFILFSSKRSLEEAACILQTPLERAGFSCLVQGEGAPQSLLTSFKQKKGCVLFGLATFWEGVDVPGSALRLVVIVKLPFPVPEDPVEVAQKELLGSSFFEQSVIPRVVQKVRQGFGRLIRGDNDVGACVFLDSRINSMAYGKKILGSLPSCPQVSGNIIEICCTLRQFYSEKGFEMERSGIEPLTSTMPLLHSTN